MVDATLDFLAQQQTRILAELADARSERANDRADMTVLVAIVQRLDASVQGLTNEVRALHGQIGRFAVRLQRIEERERT
jgi:hypothetical protein